MTQRELEMCGLGLPASAGWLQREEAAARESVLKGRGQGPVPHISLFPSSTLFSLAWSNLEANHSPRGHLQGLAFEDTEHEREGWRMDGSGNANRIISTLSTHCLH